MRGFSVGKGNGLKHPFNQETSAFGKKWFRFFLERHPLLFIIYENS